MVLVSSLKVLKMLCKQRQQRQRSSSTMFFSSACCLWVAQSRKEAKCGSFLTRTVDVKFPANPGHSVYCDFGDQPFGSAICASMRNSS